MTPIPITVITGFLGSGKTTLIRRLLKGSQGLRIGLVLNEIGQAGIDQVPEADQAYRELTEGCACCVRNSDLIAALSEMAQRTDLDRIILETSGLADPMPLTWSLRHPELSPLVELDAVIVVLDAVHHGQAGREEWEAQVRGADFAVVAKQELATESERREVIASTSLLNPQLRFVPMDDGLVANLLLDTGLDRPREMGTADSVAKHSDFGGFVIAGPERYRLSALEDLLEAMPAEVFRAKGIVQVEASQWVAFHIVGGRPQIDLDARPPPHGEGRIALFGRSLKQEPLRALFASCR